MLSSFFLELIQQVHKRQKGTQWVSNAGAKTWTPSRDTENPDTRRSNLRRECPDQVLYRAPLNSMKLLRFQGRGKLINRVLMYVEP